MSGWGLQRRDIITALSTTLCVILLKESILRRLFGSSVPTKWILALKVGEWRCWSRVGYVPSPASYGVWGAVRGPWRNPQPETHFGVFWRPQFAPFALMYRMLMLWVRQTVFHVTLGERPRFRGNCLLPQRRTAPGRLTNVLIQKQTSAYNSWLKLLWTDWCTEYIAFYTSHWLDCQYLL